jgi:hypothetical protein
MFLELLITFLLIVFHCQLVDFLGKADDEFLQVGKFLPLCLRLVLKADDERIDKFFLDKQASGSVFLSAVEVLAPHRIDESHHGAICFSGLIAFHSKII